MRSASLSWPTDSLPDTTPSERNPITIKRAAIDRLPAFVCPATPFPPRQAAKPVPSKGGRLARPARHVMRCLDALSATFRRTCAMYCRTFGPSKGRARSTKDDGKIYFTFHKLLFNNILWFRRGAIVIHWQRLGMMFALYRTEARNFTLIRRGRKEGTPQHIVIVSSVSPRRSPPRPRIKPEQRRPS